MLRNAQIASAVYLVFIVGLAIHFHKSFVMAPNEWGDYLSGILGPLTFGWLIFGYFQQGQQFNKSMEAMLEANKLTRDALKAESAPRLWVTPLPAGNNSEGTYFELSVKNVGKFAHDISFETSNRYIKFDPVGQLIANDSIEIRWMHSQFSQSCYKFWLGIRYKDVFGFESKVQYEVHVNDNDGGVCVKPMSSSVQYGPDDE